MHPTVSYVARRMRNPPSEGNHVISRSIIEAAQKSGINARVVSVEEGRENLEGPPNWTFLSSKLNAYRLPPVFSTVDDLLTSVAVASHVKSSRCDLVHVLNVTKEPYAITHDVLRVGKPLLVHFYHSHQVLGDDVFFLRNVALRAGLFGHKRGSHVLASNLLMLRFFAEQLGVKQERLHYSPYPIDTEKLKLVKNKKELRKKHNLPLDDFTIVYAGSLQPARGVQHLLNAFKKVSSKFPNTKLLICHPERKEEKIFEKQLYESIRSIGLGKDTIIKGLTTEMADIYNIADAVVLPLVRPYWIDPPLVLLEAMSTAKPVITTSVGAIGEVVTDRENGLLVKPGCPQSLVEAITDLIENPSLAHDLAERARGTIVQKHSYASVGKNLNEIYMNVLNRVD